MPAVRRGDLKIMLQDFEPDPTPQNLIYLQNRLLSPRVRTFVDWMASTLAEALAAELPETSVRGRGTARKFDQLKNRK